VEPVEAKTLALMVNRRPQSFAEAADAAMGMLEQTVPGTVILGQTEPEEAHCRAIDVRGAEIGGIERGSPLPLSDAVSQSPSGSAEAGAPDRATDEGLDRSFLDSLSVRSFLTRPLELSDGTAVGLLCAIDTGEGAYGTGHRALLACAARLLSYEWESVQARTELRRLRQQLQGTKGLDHDTGLPDRATFLTMLERECGLAQRGNVESALIAVEVRLEDRARERGSAIAIRSLKEAADVLAGTARGTDQLGRVGEMGLAAVLTGCDEAGAAAFVSRFRLALGRVTSSRSVSTHVFVHVEVLDGGTSGADVLEGVVRRARGLATEADAEPTPGQGAVEARV
jgi:GGDEF domain-containing protein